MKKNETDSGFHAKRRAEETATYSPESLDRLSPEEVRSLIHELHMHRTELELQNEERMKSTDITRQKQAETRLKAALYDAYAREREISALLKGAQAVLEHEDYQTTARRLFHVCREVIGATSGYVALLSADGEENEVLFLESGGLSCSVDEDLPMPIRGLRAEAYRLNKAVYHNDFMNSPWVEFMPEGHVVLKNVLFAPLVLKSTTVGLIGIANKGSGFDENDARIASGFGELAAIALQNSRNRDKRLEAEKQREKLIDELKKALSKVKQLSGLLPICSICKKIRDDKGYWNQIEAYIDQHSEAEFSHSLCPECIKKYYSDMGLGNKRDHEDSL